MLPGRQEKFIFKSMFASSKRHGLSKLSFVMEGGFRVARQARGNKKRGGGGSVGSTRQGWGRILSAPGVSA